MMLVITAITLQKNIHDIAMGRLIYYFMEQQKYQLISTILNDQGINQKIVLVVDIVCN